MINPDRLRIVIAILPTISEAVGGSTDEQIVKKAAEFKCPPTRQDVTAAAAVSIADAVLDRLHKNPYVYAHDQ